MKKRIRTQLTWHDTLDGNPKKAGYYFAVMAYRTMDATATMLPYNPQYGWNCREHDAYKIEDDHILCWAAAPSQRQVLNAAKIEIDKYGNRKEV